MNRKETAYYVLYQPKTNNCSAVVSYMAGYFKKTKQYYTSIKDLAIGDVVFFQNSKGLSHVGICVDWSDKKKTITTIEGNKDNKVDYGTYSYSDVGGYIAGFGKPRYTDDCTRKAVLEYAKSQIGYTEGANNWNKYADELDKVDYFAGCGKKQNLPWCAVFICAIVYNAYNNEPLTTPEPEPIEDTAPTEPEKPSKSIEEIAKEVIDGKWGNGTERKQRLTEAGYNYDEVQAKVNELLGVGKPNTETPKTYTVQKGDNLWNIASRFLGKGSRYPEIKSLNGLKSDTIYAGQVLKLPNY